MQPEAKFKQRLKKDFTALYAAVPNFYFALVASVMQMSGVPDIFVAAKGKCCWIEAKANGGKLRSTQQIVLPMMARAGAPVVVADADMDAIPDKRTITVQRLRQDGAFSFPLSFMWFDLRSASFWDAILC